MAILHVVVNPPSFFDGRRLLKASVPCGETARRFELTRDGGSGALRTAAAVLGIQAAAVRAAECRSAARHPPVRKRSACRRARCYPSSVTG